MSLDASSRPSEPFGTNPYAPPGVYARSGGDATHRVDLEATSVAWATTYYVAAALTILGSLLTVVMPDVPLLLLVPLFAGFVGSIVGIFWLGRAWAQLPYERRKFNGAPLTPLGITGRMFVPVYNLYWIFVAPRALCFELEDELRQRNFEMPMLSGIAMTASIAQLVAQAVSRFAGEPALTALATAAPAVFWITLVMQTERRLAMLRSLPPAR